MSNSPAKKDALRHAAEAQLADAPPIPGCTSEDLLHELQVHQIELEMQNEALRQAHLVMEESRDRYVSLYDFAPVGYLSLSCDGLVTEANLAVANLIGIVRAKLRNRRFDNFVAADSQDHWRQHFLAAWRSDAAQPRQCELMLKHSDGSLFPAQLQSIAIETAGVAQVVRIAISDISERKQAEEAQRIAAIAFESHEGMIVTDAHGIIIRINRAFTTLTGYDPEEVIGKTPALLRSGRQDRQFFQQMWQTLAEKHRWQGEIWNRRKNGKIYAEWLTISAVTTPDGHISHYIGSFSDITQNSEAAAEIHRLAYYDPLTHLPNRRLLQDRLGQALLASNRSGVRGAILFLDLDNFKTLNDTRGHETGDALLIELAHRLSNHVREGDTVARLGGDEFVVILEDLGSKAEDAAALARKVAEKLNEAISQPFNLKGVEFHHTASIGIGLFQGRETVEDLLKQADLALYKSKTAGRNTVRLYDPAMQAAMDERSALESELRQALKREQVLLYYQPQVDSKQRVIGAETLLRWRHPQRGLVLPNDFIPLAEETRLILPLGRWVLETACAQLHAWSRHERTRHLTLAVNVSAQQFREPGFVEQIRDILADSTANPARLKLELTESLMLDDVAETIEKMHAIKEMGVQFSMDDFGTGFSSLSYVTRLPLSQLKIDRSFVLNLPEHRSDAIIAITIVTMAKSLGLNIIAEGVETEAQRAFLEEHGCHAYQGYLFSRPLPLGDFEAFLAQA